MAKNMVQRKEREREQASAVCGLLSDLLRTECRRYAAVLFSAQIALLMGVSSLLNSSRPGFRGYSICIFLF